MCTDGKCNKDGITVVARDNMDRSEKIKPQTIGNFQNPRCFKEIKTLSEYVSIKKHS